MNPTNQYFQISGYWKDDLTEFSGYIISESDTIIEGLDDQIFYYGLSENQIQVAIKSGDKSDLEFTIMSYSITYLINSNNN
jgi:hypothetical protein